MELTGKKVAFLGDSITEGAGVVDCARNRYDNVFARLKRCVNLVDFRNFHKCARWANAYALTAKDTRRICQTLVRRRCNDSIKSSLFKS